MNEDDFKRLIQQKITYFPITEEEEEDEDEEEVRAYLVSAQ